MMKRCALGSVVVALLALPGFAAAQERVPHEGSSAIGIDVGAFMPSQDNLDPSFLTGITYEYYVTPRVSLRTDFGWANPRFDGSRDSLRQIPLRADVNYNWERGKWHPFAGAGIGAYFLQHKSNDASFGDSETKTGFNFGGGIEYFFNRNAAWKFEGRYHAVGESQFGHDPSGLALTAGVKRYF
jgi:opacity protein-like surface antigen